MRKRPVPSRVICREARLESGLKKAE